MIIELSLPVGHPYVSEAVATLVGAEVAVTVADYRLVGRIMEAGARADALGASLRVGIKLREGQPVLMLMHQLKISSVSVGTAEAEVRP